MTKTMINLTVKFGTVQDKLFRTHTDFYTDSSFVDEFKTRCILKNLNKDHKAIE
jgi:hypothetical protein